MSYQTIADFPHGEAISLATANFDPSDPYLMRIKRAAILLCISGWDHMHYQTSYNRSSCWRVKNSTVAMVYGDRIDFSYGGTYWSTTFTEIDRIPAFEYMPEGRTE